ncbi:hypothetical protein [Pseudorhodoferax sp. Leaf267]|jgi:conjugative transfer region protein (TIGR03748 family)|uniref:PFGI-1 class ICE element type IV pilus protein PilL2 n=1 Tax=Pseudorhodoferax sp. Leaf267 TaxID=1736316 RepID=UPI0006F7EC2A|nr:hypothetical protein [Pseudorhodoferax sp. Leaf267]KQP14761.1 hypothetical protein ASF43_11865 [Pseudorhodoferax sp. Leaf267]
MMERPTPEMIRALRGMALVTMAMVPASSALAGLPSDEIVLGRYTTAASRPPADLGRPLDVVVSLSFPRSTVSTVGDALQHTLLRSGYRLSQADMDKLAINFLALPLPESQRQVGPYAVHAVLGLLVGPVWTWHSDDQRRTVWFSASDVNPSVVMLPDAGPAQAQAFPVTAPNVKAKE